MQPVFHPLGCWKTCFAASGNREIADLVQQLKDLDAHAVLSGHVGVEVQPGKPFAIQAVLTELTASIRQEITEPGGQSRTHRSACATTASCGPRRWRSHRVGSSQLSSLTPAGSAVDGELQGESLRAVLAGQLDLEFLQPLLRKKFQKLGGAVSLEAKVSGTMTQPLLTAPFHRPPINAVPAGFGSAIAVPSGAVRLRSDAAELRDLAVLVAGHAPSERPVGLGANFMPSSLAVQANGEVSASLLESLVPDAVSDVPAAARIDAQVSGP